MEKGERTKETILKAAVKLSENIGYSNITREKIAIEANCAEGSINGYFHTMNQMRVAVMRYAIKNEVLKIVAQGIVNGDSRAVRAPDALKKAAIDSLS